MIDLYNHYIHKHSLPSDKKLPASNRKVGKAGNAPDEACHKVYRYTRQLGSGILPHLGLAEALWKPTGTISAS